MDSFLDLEETSISRSPIKKKHLSEHLQAFKTDQSTIDGIINQISPPGQKGRKVDESMLARSALSEWEGHSEYNRASSLSGLLESREELRKDYYAEGITAPLFPSLKAMVPADTPVDAHVRALIVQREDRELSILQHQTDGGYKLKRIGSTSSVGSSSAAGISVSSRLSEISQPRKVRPKSEADASKMSYLDFLMRDAALVPGPSDYAPAASAEGKSTGGGRFSTAAPKSDVDWLCYAAAQVPGSCRARCPREGERERDGGGVSYISAAHSSVRRCLRPPR